MTTTNNLAAQASDEPMRAAFEAWFGRPLMNPEQPSHYNGRDARSAWEAWKAATQAATPRATADVERDAARWRFRQNLLETGGAIMWARTSCQLRRNGDLLSQGATEEEAIDAAIAATKPGEPG